MKLKLAGQLVDSARTTRSQEQQLDDELMDNKDRGCRYSPRCVECPLPQCPKELKVRARK